MKKLFKIGFMAAYLMVASNCFANEGINKQFIDSATEDALINHYKTLKQHKTVLEIGRAVTVEKVYDFKLPIYKVEYSQEFYGNSNDAVKKFIYVDYVQVDNKRFIPSLMKTLRYDRKDFDFYKINNFNKLVAKCKNDEKCIQFNLGSFNKEDNISYEKTKLVQW